MWSVSQACCELRGRRTVCKGTWPDLYGGICKNRTKCWGGNAWFLMCLCGYTEYSEFLIWTFKCRHLLRLLELSTRKSKMVFLTYLMRYLFLISKSLLLLCLGKPWWAHSMFTWASIPSWEKARYSCTFLFHFFLTIYGLFTHVPYPSCTKFIPFLWEPFICITKGWNDDSQTWKLEHKDFILIIFFNTHSFHNEWQIELSFYVMIKLDKPFHVIWWRRRLPWYWEGRTRESENITC